MRKKPNAVAASAGATRPGVDQFVDIVAVVGAELADPLLAELLLAETVGTGRAGATALGLFAEVMEPKVPRTARVAFRWLRAVALERIGDIDAAERELLAAESMDVDWPLPLFDLARIASDRGDVERGLALLRRAGAGPDHPLATLLEPYRAEPRPDIGRNEPCWCGSGRKYKKCCGTPGFAAIQIDPASLVLKVELDNVDPPVWRRIAVPSNTLLDELHLVIQRAMGWQDDHPYGFETATMRFIDARFGSGEPSPDEERLISIANEVGDHFTYVYDFGDYWTHTITLEEIREAGEMNEPKTLDGAGACPPEDSGGVGRYTYLLEALADPTHADHEEAIEWFGESFDPTRYEPPVAR